MRVRIWGRAVALAGLTATLLATPGAAHADDRGVGVAISADRQSEAVNHWTAARMRAALPGEGLLSGRNLSAATAQVERGVATVIEGIAAPTTQSGGLLDGLVSPSPTSSGGGLYTGAGKVTATTGKVFFTLNGSNYVCSGSSTVAANASLVQTAGHCVNAGPGAFATNFVFVPGYRDGQAPYGKFPARALRTTTQWSGSGNLSYDVGYAIVSPVGGQYLSAKVGAQGIGFNLSRGGYLYSFGYPATTPYDGSKLAECEGTVTADTQGTSDQGMTCNMTGGSSGGPWFVNFNKSTGVGTLNSLNSFKYQTLGLLTGTKMFGPYFGSVIQSLYNAASKV